MKGILSLISKTLQIVLVCVTLSGIEACKKDEPAPNMGYTYFPEKIGSYIEYEVDSFVQDDDWGTGLDTLYQYRLKEVQRSVFFDNEGRRSIRIERYKKKFNPSIPYSQQAWSFSDAWYATRTNTGLEKVEEDMRYLRLIFPVKEGEEWNGNSKNVMESWPYEFTSANVSESVNGIPFDSIATIQQNNYSDFVTTKYGLEKYAAGVGLVYKRLILLGKQPLNSSDFPPYEDTVGLQGQQWYYPDKALIYTQKVVGFGVE